MNVMQYTLGCSQKCLVILYFKLICIIVFKAESSNCHVICQVNDI